MNTSEQDKCDFCGKMTSVMRQYLHAKNPQKAEVTGVDPHTITKYCSKCGCEEKSKIEALIEALIWCSASEDFQIEGKARKGWEKLCKPLLK